MALFIGTTLHLFEQLGSTNSHAQALITRGGLAEGAVVQAISQTAGRGQLGTVWQSRGHENLTLSVVLYPNFVAIGAQFLLNQAVALAIHDFLKPYVSTGLRIKWSNDLLVGDDKICGILIENSLQNHQLVSSVVGIGLNINQLHFQNLPHATSLQRATGIKYDLNVLRQELFDCLEARYLQLRAGRKKQIQKDYLAVLYRYGEDACYERVGLESVFWGRIIGITEAGKLEILHQNGVEAFGLKEVRFL